MFFKFNREKIRKIEKAQQKYVCRNRRSSLGLLLLWPDRSAFHTFNSNSIKNPNHRRLLCRLSQTFILIFQKNNGTLKKRQQFPSSLAIFSQSAFTLQRRCQFFRYNRDVNSMKQYHKYRTRISSSELHNKFYEVHKRGTYETRNICEQ